MKAKDIINFINEDKFSKYTMEQIYDELGDEEFVNYIDDIVRSVIKDIEGLKNAKLEILGLDLAYTQTDPKITRKLWIYTNSQNFIVDLISKKPSNRRGHTKSISSKPGQTNISGFFKTAILTACKEANLI